MIFLFSNAHTHTYRGNRILSRRCDKLNVNIYTKKKKREEPLGEFSSRYCEFDRWNCAIGDHNRVNCRLTACLSLLLLPLTPNEALSAAVWQLPALPPSNVDDIQRDGGNHLPYCAVMRRFNSSITIPRWKWTFHIALTAHIHCVFAYRLVYRWPILIEQKNTQSNGFIAQTNNATLVRDSRLATHSVLQ